MSLAALIQSAEERYAELWREDPTQAALAPAEEEIARLTEAYRIAEARAAGDRALLARLVAEGKVFRKPGFPALDDTGPNGEPVYRPKRQVNLAIRPKKKRKR